MGILKFIVCAAIVIAAIYAFVKLFPYLLTVLAVFGAVKIYWAIRDRRNDWWH